MAEVYATTPKVTMERRAIKGPPGPERVTIYAKDGRPMEVFPVDAREIVAGGEYSYEPPAPPEPVAESIADETVANSEPSLSTEPLSLSTEEPRRRGRPPKQQEAVT